MNAGRSYVSLRYEYSVIGIKDDEAEKDCYDRKLKDIKIDR